MQSFWGRWLLRHCSKHNAAAIDGRRYRNDHNYYYYHSRDNDTRTDNNHNRGSNDHIRCYNYNYYTEHGINWTRNYYSESHDDCHGACNNYISAKYNTSAFNYDSHIAAIHYICRQVQAALLIIIYYFVNGRSILWLWHFWICYIRPTYCLFLLSLLFIVYFLNLCVSFFRCYHHLINKYVYIVIYIVDYLYNLISTSEYHLWNNLQFAVDVLRKRRREIWRDRAKPNITPPKRQICINKLTGIVIVSDTFNVTLKEHLIIILTWTKIQWSVGVQCSQQ